MPDSIFQKDYSDVRDFYENLKYTSFSFRVNGLQVSDSIIFFSFASGQKILHAYYRMNNESLILADRVIEDLRFGDWEEMTTFTNLPCATDGKVFYQLLEPFALKQRMDSLKITMTPKQWHNYESQNPVLSFLYKKTSLTNNPIIVKLDPK